MNVGRILIVVLWSNIRKECAVKVSGRISGAIRCNVLHEVHVKGKDRRAFGSCSRVNFDTQVSRRLFCPAKSWQVQMKSLRTLFNITTQLLMRVEKT